MSEEYVVILDDKDEHLRMKSTDVRLPLSKKDDEIMQGLIKYVVDSRNPELAEQYGLQAASGLAAPQIGVNKKMIVVAIEEEGDDEETVLQHEIDHLNGTLFYDHINKYDPYYEYRNAIVID